jgi:uncharacterized protein
MTRTSVSLSIKVVPNASRTEIISWLGDDLKVRVQAPPEDGKANATLLKHLAKQLKCPCKQIVLESGEFSPQKRVRIEGFDRAHLLSTLGISDHHG